VTDPVDHVARAVARQLTADYGPVLPAQVEAALHMRGLSGPPTRYGDPVSVASLVVSVAALAWTVYIDLRKRTPTPSQEVLARTVRVRVEDAGELSHAERDRIIDIVVEETARVGEQPGPYGA